MCDILKTNIKISYSFSGEFDIERRQLGSECRRTSAHSKQPLRVDGHPGPGRHQETGLKQMC